MPILACDIVDAVNQHLNSFQTLRDVTFRCECAVNAGNSAVIFRVWYRGEDYALRCYQRRHPYLSEIYGDKLFIEEMEVCGERLDIVLVPWIEGESLSCFTGDWAFASRAFEELVKEMLSRKGWAHGDLSADNLIIDSEKMHYIDCDNNFVEALRGKKSLALGTPAYQSPLRQESDFDETIDHFSIALIAVALKALSHDKTLADRYPFLDGLLLDGAQVGKNNYEIFQHVEELLASKGEFATYRLARLLRYNPLRIDYLREILKPPTTTSTTLVSVKIGLAWGYCDEEGRVVIAPLFDEAFEFKSKYALVRVDKWWYRIDRRGRAMGRYDDKPKK